MKRIFNLMILILSLTILLSDVAIADKATKAMKPEATMAMKPNEGWALHVDAKMHFPNMPEMIAHHYCKPVSGGLTECLLFDSDMPDARLVGIEVIVSAEIYKKFSKKEKALWHYHKTEIPKVGATLPEHSPEEAAKIVKSMEETYGKVYLLWDPGKGAFPMGKPMVHILK